MTWLVAPLFVLLAGLLLVTSAQAQTTETSEEQVDFATQIKPLLEQHCIRCHGPESQEADFRIDERDNVFNWIDPGSAEYSDLWVEYIASEDETQMMPPPDEGGPLPAEQIALFERWIDEGADWPETVSLVMPAPEVIEEIEQEVAEQQQAQDQKDSSLQLVWEIAGLLHPMLLHFPVALLIGGAFFALFGFRGESPLADAAYYCLWLAALTGILACVSGWSFAIDKNYTDWDKLDFTKSIDLHRWGGILVTVLAFLLALVASGSRRRDPYGTGAFWKLGMIVLAVLVGFVAHHGGKMTHTGLHDKLINKSETLFQNITGEKRMAPVEEEPAEGTDDEDDTAKESQDPDNTSDETGDQVGAGGGEGNAAVSADSGDGDSGGDKSDNDGG
ncbi:MAG: c-type cytochrome domain-containing protein [Pirellulaceae bacterium]